MTHSYLHESAGTLAHATAIIGIAPEAGEAFLAQLGVSPFDTVRLDAGESGGIADVRRFANQMLTSPQYGEVRLGAIFNADGLTPEAQNALLKLLEEPPVSTKLILFLRAEAATLPTVFSRCRLYYTQERPGNEAIGAYLRDPIAQMLDAENLAKDDAVIARVRGWLIAAYQDWVQSGRPADGLAPVISFWECYKGMEAGINKRLLLEQLVLSSL